MPNVHDPEKELVTYGEFTDVRDELEGAAQDLSKLEGRKVTVSEIYRKMAQQLANRRRKARGAAPLKHDTASKPGGTSNVRRRKVAAQ